MHTPQSVHIPPSHEDNLRQMELLLNDYLKVSLSYSKIEDDMDIIGVHDTTKKEELRIQAGTEWKKVEESKNEIRAFIFSIFNKDEFDVLLKQIKENFSDRGDKIILNSLEDIFAARYEGFKSNSLKADDIINSTEGRLLEILDEGINPYEGFEIDRCHIGIVSSMVGCNKSTIKKNLLALLDSLAVQELNDFAKEIRKTGDIDAEVEAGMNLYSFAIVNGFDEITKLILEYKSR